MANATNTTVLLLDQSANPANENPARITLENGEYVMRWAARPNGELTSGGKPFILKAHGQLPDGSRIGFNHYR